MPKKLKRYYGRGELHFVTFSCNRRWPLLAKAYARNLFVKDLDACASIDRGVAERFTSEVYGSGESVDSEGEEKAPPSKNESGAF